MLKEKVLLGTFILGSLSLAAGMETAVSSAVISSNQIKTSKEFLYIAKDFSEVAVLPGFSINAPIGLVPGAKAIFAGISGTYNNVENTDGGMGFGFGYGNPYENLGGAVSLSLGSINPDDGGAFNRGNLNFSVGHIFKKYGVGVAVGMSGATLWHDNENDDLEPSFYGAVTKLLPNNLAPVILTVGVGNNAYADTNTSGDKKDKIYGFVSGAIYILPQVSLIADYTSGVTSLGFGVVPFPTLPITLTAGAYDIAKQGTQNKISFIGGLSTAYVF